MSDGVIYRIILSNGKNYVGQTVNFRKRKWDHIGLANRGSLFPVHCAMRKYPDHKFEIIERCLKDELNFFEHKHIGLLKSLATEKGYNLDMPDPNGRGYVKADSTKLKISLAQKGNTYAKGNKGKIPWNKGIPQSPEHVAKRIAARKATLEARKAEK